MCNSAKESTNNNCGTKEINVGFNHGEDDVEAQQDSGLILDQLSQNIPTSDLHNVKNVKSKLTSNSDSGLVEDLQPSGEICGSFEVNKKEIDAVSEQLVSMNFDQILPLQRKHVVIDDNPREPHKIFCDKLNKWKKHYNQDNDGETHLHLAIIHKCFEMQMALLRLAPAPCLLDIQNVLFQSPLHLAVLTEQPATVRKLLLAGADTNIKDRHGNTPLHLACSNGDVNCVRALTRPITADEFLEATKLQKQYFDYVKKCIYRPNLEQRNYDGEYCVHIATARDDVEILRYLLYCGVDINVRDGKSGRTPLHIAIEDGKVGAAKLLLNVCKTLCLETNTFAGLTAYQLAAVNQNKEVIQDLAKLGAIQLTPPDSEVEEDDDDNDDLEFDDDATDRYSASCNFVNLFNGAAAINVS